jgi:hypothetical protein
MGNYDVPTVALLIQLGPASLINEERHSNEPNYNGKWVKTGIFTERLGVWDLQVIL